MDTQNLTGLYPEEIAALLPATKEKYRSMQIFRWIHEHGVSSFDEMTNLSKAFRAEIAGKFSIGLLKPIETMISDDRSTDKYLWELFDGTRIESVVIRDGDRNTLCISSQVGCKMSCAFCRTGDMGFTRNLRCGEIVDQLIQIRKSLKANGEDIRNIVFMGMGEPLDNIEAVIKAIKIINMETALEIGQRKITVSTCGVVPGMHRLAREFKRIGLAISLNAVDDKLRNELMPINRKYPLAALLDATRSFSRNTKRRVTFEYILIDGVNDSPAHARRLIKLIKGIPCKINLIALNEYEGSPYRRSSDEAIAEFQRILIDGHLSAFLRKSKGSEILAACGQLASKASQ